MFESTCGFNTLPYEMSKIRQYSLVQFSCDDNLAVVSSKVIKNLYQGEFSYLTTYKVSYKATEGGPSKLFDCKVLLFSGNNCSY